MIAMAFNLLVLNVVAVAGTTELCTGSCTGEGPCRKLVGGAKLCDSDLAEGCAPGWHLCRDIADVSAGSNLSKTVIRRDSDSPQIRSNDKNIEMHGRYLAFVYSLLMTRCTH